MWPLREGKRLVNRPREAGWGPGPAAQMTLNPRHYLHETRGQQNTVLEPSNLEARDGAGRGHGAGSRAGCTAVLRWWSLGPALVLQTRGSLMLLQ